MSAVDPSKPVVGLSPIDKLKAPPSLPTREEARVDKAAAMIKLSSSKPSVKTANVSIRPSYSKSGADVRFPVARPPSTPPPSSSSSSSSSSPPRVSLSKIKAAAPLPARPPSTPPPPSSSSSPPMVSPSKIKAAAPLPARPPSAPTPSFASSSSAIAGASKEAGFKGPVQEMTDLLLGKGITSAEEPLGNSAKDSLEGAESINAQFKTDCKRFDYLMNGAMKYDHAISQRDSLKNDQIFSFCKSIYDQYGPDGLKNLAKILNQAALADLTQSMIDRHKPPLFVISDAISFDVLTADPALLTVRIKSNYVIKHQESGLVQGNQKVVRDIALQTKEISQPLDPGNPPTVIVREGFSALLPPTPAQEKFNERMSA